MNVSLIQVLMVSAVCVYGPKDVLVPFVSGAWKIVQLEFSSKLALLEDKHDCTANGHHLLFVPRWADGGELKSTGVDYRERKATKLMFVCWSSEWFSGLSSVISGLSSVMPPK